MAIVLFGAGNIGRMVKDSLKPKSVDYYVDNNSFGKNIDSVEVRSFEYLRRNIAGAVIVITTSLKNACAIAKQLEQSDIFNFIYWKELFTEFDDICEEAELFRNVCTEHLADNKEIAFVKSLLRYPMKTCMDSQVEFYFVDYFEFVHYLPIYEELVKRGIRTAMVTEPSVYNTKSTFNYEDTIQLLDDAGITHYTLANSNTPVAVTTQFPHNLSHYKNKKCHLAYGVSMTKGKSFILEKANCEGFDLIMVNGEFYRRMIIENGFKGQIINISYPRYREFFKSVKNKDSVLNKLGVHTSKPIIIYLPTYDDESSIQQYAMQINKLRGEYFIITRPHHCTWYRENKKNDLKRIFEISDLVVDPLSPLTDMAIIADYAICDARSGVMNEISFLNPEVKKIALLTNPDLNQFYIDITKFVDVVQTPDDLSKHLESIKHGDAYKEIRKSYTEDFYGKDVNKGIERAVEAIISLLG